MKLSLVCFLLWIFALTIYADSNVTNSRILQDSIQLEHDSISNKILRVTDFFSLIVNKDKLERNEKGLLVPDFSYEPFDSFMNFSDTMILAPYFLPIVFDGSVLPENLSFFKDSDFKEDKTVSLIDKDSIVGTDLFFKKEKNESYVLLNEDESFYPLLQKQNRTWKMRKNYYMENPDKITLQDSDLKYDIPQNVTDVFKENPFKELISAEEVSITRPQISRHKIKQKYWKVRLSNTLDLSQAQYTDNWESQGSSSTSLNSLQRLDIVYRKKKIEFTHWTEWKLVVQRWSLTDEEKNAGKAELLLNEDYLRTYNKVGIDAFVKKWSYIVTLDMKTPLFVKRNKDDKEKKMASLLSPLELNLGLGAGFTSEWKSKKNKYRSSKLSIDASPLSIQTKYVGSNEVWDNNNYGVVYEGEKASERRYSKTEFGATVTATLDYKISSVISFYSRNKFFTNYHKVLFESENTLDLRLNRYLSTKLYFYGVFNDGVDQSKKDPRWKYFSYTDQIRFGLSFKW